MRVLVTGAAGYVGSVVTGALLAAGHHVVAIDSLRYGGGGLVPYWGADRFSFVRADIRDTSATSAAVAGCDQVVHLAAIVGDPACKKMPEDATSINLEATKSLATAARAAGVERFIFASTCSNYGISRDGLASEDTPLRPLSLYAETKVEAERFLAAEATPSFRPTVLRFATVFGMSPRPRFDLTVNDFVREAVVRGCLRVYGRSFSRPYVHVRDLAEAIVLAGAAPISLVGGATFNVGSTAANHTKDEIVEVVRRHVPNLTVEYVDQTVDPRDYRVSFERISRELSFVARRSISDGAREILDAITNGVVDPDSPGYTN